MDLGKRPFFRDAGYASYSKKGYLYNEHGRLAKIVYVDKNEKPLITVDRLYGAAGEEVDRTYTGQDGKKLQPRVRISHVTPKSQWETLGIRPGDIVLAYNRKKIKETSDLLAAASVSDGGPREVLIRREKELMRFKVPPGLLNIFMEDIFEPASTAEELGSAIGP